MSLNETVPSLMNISSDASQTAYKPPRCMVWFVSYQIKPLVARVGSNQTFCKPSLGLIQLKWIHFIANTTSNVPVSFPEFINDILSLFLDIFCKISSDIILIYSNNRRKQKEYVRAVMTLLNEASLYHNTEIINILKTELQCLRFFFGINRVRKDLKKA
jgi:hypothetical protein